ncbi:serine hydrolase [Tabrizicola sp.]|uniref:serine hydrolase domain-containing protein n=1 Tax=Tabrizicola sp. TaxID=2005166 RepID=UPI0027331542|nr:serine hydrolase domain-containing protein [Tabrizicola sp.]MDP3195132.1 serine hydrolase domain-containing protein [Tabrizicola sp.]
MPLTTHPTPDLAVGPDRHPHWNSAPNRRQGFHSLHRVARYTQTFRAARVLDLRLSADLSIPQRADVCRLTALPWFSAMAVTEGNRLLYESYAPDFAPDQPHAIMSISKLVAHLILGRLWEDGRIGMDETLGDILPRIGPGYHGATVQDVANMNVHNAYDEDYTNPDTTAFLHEEAMGMRLPKGPEPAIRDLLAAIGLAEGASDTRNPTGTSLYKSANTDVLMLAAEARGGRPLRLWLADLADAAGIEGALHIGTDRQGMPIFSGGICLTARDLCRYGALIARKGQGADGQPFGSAAFLESTRRGGVTMPAPRAHLRYSNQTNTDGIWVGHGGYGGQYLVANPETGRVACFLSVLQNEAGFDAAYYPPIIRMLAAVCAG